jgi:hypothetical protein
VSLKVGKVVFQFLPAMAEGAVEASFAALFVLHDFLVAVPGLTRNGFDGLRKGAFEVLPVVGVDALEAIVADLGEGTELGLEGEKEEVLVDGQEVQGNYLQLKV